MHPNFYFSLFLAVLTNASIASLAYVFIKTVDVGLKFVLMEQVFVKRKLSSEMSLMLLTPLHPYLAFISLIVYPPIVYLALTASSF